jgi:transposase
MYTLIEAAKLNGVDPEAWLTDVINRIAAHPWNWRPTQSQARAA